VRDIVISLAPRNASTPTETVDGLPYWTLSATNQRIPRCYGFRVRPLLDQGALVGTGNAQDRYSVSWTKAPPGPPGPMPLVARVLTPTGVSRVLVRTGAIYSFGGMLDTVEFLLPNQGLAYPVQVSSLFPTYWVLTVYETPGELSASSSGEETLRTIQLWTQDAYTLPAFGSGGVMLASATTALSACGSCYTPANRMDFFGLSSSGTDTYGPVSAGWVLACPIYIFECYRRWRMVLQAVAAQDIYLYTVQGNGGVPSSNQETGTPRYNETIPAAAWLASVTNPGKFELTVERECSFADEWILPVCSGAADTVRIMSAEAIYAV
jgi:hypothetical protein